MNERIKELAEHAKQYALKSMVEFSHTPIESIKVYDRTYNEKFAELIVRECARISQECDDTMTNQGLASAQAFMEHFGVEE